MRRPLLAAALLVGAVALGSAPGFRFHRDVAVERAGWYRLPLDLTALGHSLPDLRDVRLQDPSGAEVPYERLPGGTPSRSIPATLQGVTPQEGGWSLLFDLGPAPGPHDRFRFVFGNAASVPGCRLEGSPDGKGWVPLATGDLFRAGEAASYQSTAFDYDATPARLLRLSWPRSAGFPQVREAAAERVAEVLPRLSREALPLTEETRGPGRVTVRLDLPGPAVTLRRLTPRWEGAGTVGVRLLAPAGGTWTALAEAVLTRPSTGEWAALALPQGTAGASVLKMELFAGGGASPKLAGVDAEYEPVSLRFYAPAPGTYRLVYGGLGMAPPAYPEGPAAPAQGEPAALVLGAEREDPAGGSSFPGLGPGSELPKARFEAAWAVTSPGAAPGDVIHLELPPDAYARLRPDLGDLRLDYGGRQVPYILWSPPDPAPASTLRGAVPKADRARAVSVLALEVPQDALPLTSLELTTDAVPFRRTVTLSWVEERRPGFEPARPTSFGWSDWRCEGAALLPCRLCIPVTPHPARRLEVLIGDGDNPPLASVDMVLWRRRHVLVFGWPGDGALTLRAGSADLSGPRYDLADLRDQLLARPSRAAALQPLDEALPPGRQRWVRWGLIGALAAAALLLLALLARALRPGPRPTSGK